MKYCKDCKHAEEGGSLVMPYPFTTAVWCEWLCSHPDAGNPVTGAAQTCDLVRASTLLCGGAGKLWEEGEPKPFTRISAPPAKPTQLPVDEDAPKARWWWSRLISL